MSHAEICGQRLSTRSRDFHFPVPLPSTSIPSLRTVISITVETLAPIVWFMTPTVIFVVSAGSISYESHQGPHDQFSMHHSHWGFDV